MPRQTSNVWLSNIIPALGGKTKSSKLYKRLGAWRPAKLQGAECYIGQGLSWKRHTAQLPSNGNIQRKEPRSYLLYLTWWGQQISLGKEDLTSSFRKNSMSWLVCQLHKNKWHHIRGMNSIFSFPFFKFIYLL